MTTGTHVVPLRGSSVRTASDVPALSAMQRDAEGQLRLSIPKEGGAAATVSLHAELPPAGSFDVTTPPRSSLATQSDVDGHETLVSDVCPPGAIIPIKKLRSTYATFHAPRPPVGSVDVTTSPYESPATHSDTDGHDTESKAWGGWRYGVHSLGHGPESTVAVCHAEGPPVGFEEVATAPALSTDTHNDTDGQDTARSAVVPLILALCQPVSLAGVVDQKTYPAVSTATQSDAEGQEIPDNEAEHVLSPQLCVLLSM
jgi:hypothetical protein